MTLGPPPRHCIPSPAQHGDINASSTATRTTHRALLADTRLCLCTGSCTSRDDLREFLYACYEGGTDIIQLCNKRADTRGEIVAAETLAEIAAEHGRLFAVNGRVDIAALTGADILHVGQEGLTTEQAHQIAGPGVLIGRFNRNLDMFAASLVDDGIDYAVIGPVYTAPTKSDRQPVGVDMAREAAALVRRVRAQGSVEPHQDSVADIVRPHDRSTSDPVKPWWAIGGINAETAGEAIDAGMERTVVVCVLAETANPEEAARALRAAVIDVDGINSHGDK